MNSATPDRRMLAGIQTRLVIAFLTVATIPVVVLAIYGAQNHLRALEELAFNSAGAEARLRARKLQDALAGAQSDLFYLTQIPSLDTYIEAGRKPDELDVNYARDKLAKQFEAFIGSRGTYRAAVYVDRDGHEGVRVRRIGRMTTIVPFVELRSHPARQDLLLQGENLLAGQVLTRIEIEPTGTVAHFVTRLFPRGLQRRGFVVLEIGLSTLWEDDELGLSAAQIVVFDQSNQPILGKREDISPEILASLASQPNQPMETPQGQIATFVPILPDRINPGEQWSFVAVQPRALVFASLVRFRRVFTLVLLLTLAAAASISVLLARQFTIPLKRLYAAAQEIGHGRFDVPLTDDTGDEIGGLARELRAMAEKLKIKHDDMQQQIDEKTRDLLQAERLSTIGTMSAAIAHEVNNPLGIISLYSQMLLDKMPPDDPRTGKLRTIAREASRMSVLVRGLLQFARRPELNLTRVDLAALINEAVALSASLQEDVDRIEVRTSVSTYCPWIEADADQLGQVLRNLIINAFHALTGGGRLTISAEPLEAGRIALRVSDTGCGIAPDHLRELFEPFFTTRRFGAGTGLGLTISKEIVERHGGTISVASELGQGTTFTIALPVRAAPATGRENPADRDAQPI